MGRKHFIIIPFLLVSCFSHAQEFQIPLYDDYEMEFQTAAYSSDYIFHTALRGWSESHFEGILNLDSVLELYRIPVSRKGVFSDYIRNSVLNYDFVRFNKDEFYLALNPYIDFSLGSDTKKTTWTNEIGAEIKMSIGKKFAFYAKARKSLTAFPEYIENYCETVGVVPGHGGARKFNKTGI